jgi:hypothetical protein
MQKKQEILMEEESDEKLEDLNEFFEHHENISSSGNEAVRPHVIEDYNAHMDFVDKSERMVNSYGIDRRTWKLTKKLFSHLLHMAILNAYLLHNSCGGKVTHKKFCEILVRDFIVQSHEENITVSGISRRRPSSSGAN